MANTTKMVSIMASWMKLDYCQRNLNQQSFEHKNMARKITHNSIMTKYCEWSSTDAFYTIYYAGAVNIDALILPQGSKSVWLNEFGAYSIDTRDYGSNTYNIFSVDADGS